MVCRQGASKPVIHMSRTITMRKGSKLHLNRVANSRRFSLLRIWGCQSGPSSALPVMTTLSVSSAQAGRSLIRAS